MMKFLDRCRVFNKVMIVLAVITGAWSIFFWIMGLLYALNGYESYFYTYYSQRCPR